MTPLPPSIRKQVAARETALEERWGNHTDDEIKALDLAVEEALVLGSGYVDTLEALQEDLRFERRRRGWSST